MTSRNSLSGHRCVVVGGAGAVGSMFVDLLRASGAEVCVVDARGGPTEPARPCAFEQGDITDIGPRIAAELGRAEVVVLAVPGQVALAAVKGVAEAMRPGALLVDTLSVKSDIVATVRAQGAHLEAVSLNPLFAPSLGIEGRPVAAIVVHDGPRGQGLLRLIARWGGRIIQVTEDEHDRLAGATQALAHAAVLAFGLALLDLDVDIAELSELAPPPCVTLLALLARITSGEPETYWDVQAANQHAPLAREALARSVRRLADAIEHGGERGFAAVLAQLRDSFGRDLQHYRELGAQAFEALHRLERSTAPTTGGADEPA